LSQALKVPEFLSLDNIQTAVHTLAGYGELALVDELTALAATVGYQIEQ
jgi:hypothetical protein